MPCARMVQRGGDREAGMQGERETETETEREQGDPLATALSKAWLQLGQYSRPGEWGRERERERERESFSGAGQRPEGRRR